MIYGVYLLRKILKLEFYTSSYKVCYVYVVCTPEYPHDPEYLGYPPHLVLTKRLPVPSSAHHCHEENI